MAKFEIKKTVNNKFYFILKAKNGEIILQSETYHSKQGAENAIDSIKENAPIATIDDQT